MKTNTAHFGKSRTHEGAVSEVTSPSNQLRRAVMSCMLFERSFYESGEHIATRITRLVREVPFDDVASIAIEARERMKLRHVPLLLVRELIRNHSGRKVGDLIARVIQRPDELGELVSLYWKDDGKRPLTNQLKVGLSRAIKKFDAYQLAKWNRDAAIKLRDVLFLCHPRPDNDEQAILFKQLADNRLPTPDTWEVSLSGGADKRGTFERLLTERGLGAMALLRNMRNMVDAGVSEDLIRDELDHMNTYRVLPFRFISAARHAPKHIEDALEGAMLRGLQSRETLPGKTALLIDHSSSMGHKVSNKSEVTRFDAAAGLAMILREVCERVRVFTFSDCIVEVAPRRGFALLQAVREVVRPYVTLLGAAVRHVYNVYPECDRIIVITDEQSEDRPPAPQGRGYIINVSVYQQGIGYGPWVTINGWSEAIVDYIYAFEQS